MAHRALTTLVGFLLVSLPASAQVIDLGIEPRGPSFLGGQRALLVETTGLE